MQKIKIKYYTPSIAEKFFIEKADELLDPKTIDSYRLRMHNPLTILKEAKQVISDLNNNLLKNESYALTSIQEASFLINTENELVFRNLSKEYYKQLLDPKGGAKIDLKQIFYSTNLVIKDNENYVITLFDKIISEISRLNEITTFDILNFKSLNGVIGFFFIELIHRGFSKTYLYYFFRSIFFGPNHGSFNNRMGILKTLISRSSEKFSLIVGIKIPGEQAQKITIIDNEFKLVKKKEKKEIIKKSNVKISYFFDKYKGTCLFYIVDVSALDFFSAVKLTRVKLQTLFDLIHMGHSDVKISVIEECASIGENNPTKAATIKLQFYLDGYYKSEQKLYSDFLNKIKLIQDKKISTTTISKINSGLRYSRLGFDSAELENKLLNYWIGIEYLFSSNEEDSYTVGRLRNYYKKCHAVIYFKRTLKYFHDSILVHQLEKKIKTFSGSLEYLNDENSYSTIISEYNKSPLLSYRANSFKEQLLLTSKTKGTLINHQKNLDWNLNRIYRLRNEIVHNAAIQPNIENVTSHLRYYLVFILNGLLDFLNNEPIDVNSDNELNIDDYFIVNEILIENICKDENYQKFPYLLKMHNPVEYLS